MKNFFIRGASLLLFTLGLVSQAFAGGALKTNIDGLPFTWGGSISFNAEQGSLKNGIYNNEQSIQLIEEAFQTWTSVSGVNLSVKRGPSLPDHGDTNINNYPEFYYANPWNCYDEDSDTPCYNPIIFDEDGSIIEDMFGECTQFSILGFSGFTDVAGENGAEAWTELKRGQAIFSGACIAPAISKPGCPPCNVVLEPEDVKTLILHEMGHFIGLGHSQVNPDSYLSCRASGTCTASEEENIPTMFPFLVKGAKMLTLHQDDVVSVQRLYGNPKQGTCSIAGKILAQDGTSELRGVEVIARNVDQAQFFTDAISYVSGEEAPRFTVKDKTQGNCMGDCGRYEIAGLRDGQTYQICVQRILDKFTETRAIPPLDPPFQGIDNECPQGQTFTCDCTGGNCSEFTGVDLVTTNNGLDFANSSIVESLAPAGGCSLIPARNHTWKRISLTLLRFPASKNLPS